MPDTSPETVRSEAPDKEPDLQSRFPTAYTILFLLIILVAALTWIIPAGQYDRQLNEEIGREVAVPGTYQTVESNPQGPIDVLLAPTMTRSGVDRTAESGSFSMRAVTVGNSIEPPKVAPD